MTRSFNVVNSKYTSLPKISLPYPKQELELAYVTNKLALATETYSYVCDRHNEILRLEKSIQELNQLFIDMSAIVDIQDDIINKISYRIETAREECREAKEEVVIAYRYKRKNKCIIM